MRAKVLIIDNDPMLLTILAESFQKYHRRFDLYTAKNGLEAVKKLQKHSFDVLVTDLYMPHINGLVLLTYMSRNHPDIPCIVMTGHGTPFLKKQLKKEIAYYITKPFSMQELAQAIINALGNEIVKGALNGISVAGFLKMIEIEYKTCLCEIILPDGSRGYLYFEFGVLFNAFHGALKGEAAAFRLLLADNVVIKFRKAPKITIPRQIKTELGALIEEAGHLRNLRSEIGNWELGIGDAK
ncbi:response regulator [Desulfococcaceae bacterium HSG7]|nr:response regulator [Desulfococcaceae bacterium HSG7]